METSISPPPVDFSGYQTTKEQITEKKSEHPLLRGPKTKKTYHVARFDKPVQWKDFKKSEHLTAYKDERIFQRKLPAILEGRGISKRKRSMQLENYFAKRNEIKKETQWYVMAGKRIWTGALESAGNSQYVMISQVNQPGGKKVFKFQPIVDWISFHPKQRTRSEQEIDEEKNKYEAQNLRLRDKFNVGLDDAEEEKEKGKEKPRGGGKAKRDSPLEDEGELEAAFEEKNDLDLEEQEFSDDEETLVPEDEEEKEDKSPKPSQKVKLTKEGKDMKELLKKQEEEEEGGVEEESEDESSSDNEEPDIEDMSMETKIAPAPVPAKRSLSPDFTSEPKRAKIQDTSLIDKEEVHKFLASQIELTSEMISKRYKNYIKNPDTKNELISFLQRMCNQVEKNGKNFLILKEEFRHTWRISS
jgi:hypothetical protein